MTERTEHEPGAARALLAWLRDCPALAGHALHYGHLPARGGLMLAPDPGGAVVRRYIGGGGTAEYPFRLVLRTLPAEDGERLTAEETLLSAAAWMEDRAGTLTLTDGAGVRGIRTRTGAVTAAGENGAQDRALHLILQVEVI